MRGDPNDVIGGHCRHCGGGRDVRLPNGELTLGWGICRSCRSRIEQDKHLEESRRVVRGLIFATLINLLLIAAIIAYGVYVAHQ